MHDPFHDNNATCTYIYILIHIYDTFIKFKKTYLQLFLGILTKYSGSLLILIQYKSETITKTNVYDANEFHEKQGYSFFWTYRMHSCFVQHMHMTYIASF